MWRCARRPLRACAAKPSRTALAMRSMATVDKSSTLSLPDALHERTKVEPLAASFEPQAVERGWQAHWQHVLQAHKRERGARDKFTMILPPPNVTGALHIGHALTITIQDTLARWHRMRGRDVDWIPGLDHAGIATQSVVERKLMKEKAQTKDDLGRDAFVGEVWKWNEQYGGRILDQIDHLGATVDKQQHYFTLDDTRSKAVIDAFVRLYDQGLVYRRRRMVNWCPTLKTAISDIEVDSEQLTQPTLKVLPGHSQPVEFGVMHRIHYKLADSDETLLVDTTRPETIFGDVAVAIHPDDERYKRYHGKHVLHPFTNERIPIVLDSELVNMELGTGVVKITPAHDPKDYECGLRHSLEEVEVIDAEGKMCGRVPESYLGIGRFEARKRIPHATTLSICSRSGNIIEPLLMPQWFVDTSQMAKRAADNVRSGALAIEPKSHIHTWFFFLDNMQDWCVSRQLWWGHRIPAYRIRNHPTASGNEWVVARSLEEAKAKASAMQGVEVSDSDLEQDNDVLDTWFSSGLLPLSVFGWPDEQNPDVAAKLKAKYPLDVMETGSDILFFWVARMAMLCEQFSGELPFKRVLLHPMVRDKTGRKMSKSLGNVIDPLHVIHGISLEKLTAGLLEGNISPREIKKAEKDLKREFPKGIPSCGTDALRLALASYLQQGRQINMDVQRIVSYRHFCNKVWNAVRYALPLLKNESLERQSLVESKQNMALADKWILSRLAEAVATCNAGIESGHLASSVAALQRFFVQELCDVYIEFSKPILYGNRLSADDFQSEDEIAAKKLSAQSTLFHCLDQSLRLFHPFTPFVTEELWHRLQEHQPAEGLGTKQPSILSAAFPESQEAEQWRDLQAEAEMSLVLDIIHGIRSLKHTIKTIAPNATTSDSDVVEIVCSNDQVQAMVAANTGDIAGQSRIRVTLTTHEADSACLTHSVSDSCKIAMQVPQDSETSQRVQKEVARLEKRVQKSTQALQALEQRRAGPEYRVKVPEAVQAQDEARVTQLETEILATTKSLSSLQGLQQYF
ncbi:TPA: hypothetical protein N0F65_005953 [Lagenidium giganteum]|uniref:valine--tRNA ligase n=1 Tax=Lagenidium giganteum TaxID=4803 RepID=A0AAV2Z9F8_9STRA|nr:TPA: hypothetical protein N0F65_005953 [Lagenidium giganteum]